MKMQLKEVTNHIPAGDYQGTIVEQNESSDGKFLWLKIKVDEAESTLSTSIYLNSVMFYNFAKYFADDNGEIDTEDFLDTMVQFTVADKKCGDNIYSKLTKLSPVFEEEVEKD